MADQSKMLAGGALVAVLLMAWACSPDESPTAGDGRPLTVRSAETFADMTLSDGQRVHNTQVDYVASDLVSSTYGSYTLASDEQRNTCITRALNQWAVDNLTGRQVSELSPASASYNVAPMSGYSPSQVYFIGPPSSASPTRYDVTTDLQRAKSDAYSTCSASTYSSPTTTTTTEPAPTTTTEPPVYVDPDPDVYVAPDPDVYVDTPDYSPPKKRTGHSGHLCLPGERDGDGDGYCKE